MTEAVSTGPRNKEEDFGWRMGDDRGLTNVCKKI